MFLFATEFKNINQRNIDKNKIREYIIDETGIKDDSPGLIWLRIVIELQKKNSMQLICQKGYLFVTERFLYKVLGV
ncbi:MAG TPA: hypothetical protein VIY08_15555 [Candidatus Nitrosocosmicus sp.]